MKRLVALIAGIFLSASLIASANADPAKAPGIPAKSSVVQNQPQGITNAKKIMKARFDREKRMIEVRKKAQAKKHQANRAS
jgi:Spy/CpxP family protein refolding chaperone